MVENRSDDELRRVVFGRGYSVDEVTAASTELRRRSTSNTPPPPSSEAGAPAPQAGGADEDASAVLDEGAPSEDQQTAGRGRGDSRTVVIAAVVAVIALASGWLLGTAGSFGVGMPVASSTPTTADGKAAVVVDPDTGATVFEVPAGRPDYLSQASSSRLPEAVEPDPADTRLPAVFDNVDTATARYIGRIGDLKGAWTARNSSGEYCAVIAVNDSGAYSWSCVSVGAFAERGVSIGSGRYSLLWNSASAILSMTAD